MAHSEESVSTVEEWERQESTDATVGPISSPNLLPIHSSDHLPTILNLIEPKDEEIDNYVNIPPKDEMPNLIEPKEEEIDNYVYIPPKDEKSAMDSMGSDIKKEDILNEDLDSSETAKVEKRKIASRISSNSVKDAETAEEYDGEIESSVKKSKIEVKKSKSSYSARFQSVKNGCRPARKENNTELECLECEYRSKSVGSWMVHLRNVHNTTPTLSGCLLRCECGHESVSHWHSYECEISNITVIRKGNGPILRLTDNPVTPQCLLCEVYPKTTRGYLEHLLIHHHSSLEANGIYLLCSCEFKANNRTAYLKNHDKKCGGRLFTLHNRNDD